MGRDGARFTGTRRFQVKRVLGAGGMGVVYEAFDREKNVAVALKTLRHVEAKGLERFKKEFRALQGLEHPNVVSLGELLEVEGEWFFTMELVDGCDFLSYVCGPRALEPTAARASGGAGSRTTAPACREADWQLGTAENVAASHQLDEARLRSSLRQLARGLVALHGGGLVHRDIKPSNILITPQGRTVLMDFGLVAESSASRQSTAARVVGTPAYMAPEQANGEAVSGHADWYSVGVLLYEALTGRLPFEGPAVNLLMHKLQHDAPPPSTYAPQVPPDLEALCMDLLRRAPEQRPSAAAILDRLGIDDLVPSGTPSSSRQQAPVVPFVGRERELARLGEAFDAVDEKPVVVLVEGESGMGKTSLVEHFVATKTRGDRGAVVLTGRCYEREQVPYKAFDGVADSLARLLVHMRSEEVAWVMPLCAGLLPLLFPVLQRVDAIARAPLEPVLADPQEQRTRMFSAFREALLRLAQRRRLIIILDDLHWTDADSLTLFEEVFGHGDAPPVLILATLHPVDVDKRVAMSKAMEMVEAVSTVHVEALPVAQTRELAALLMPGRLTSDIQALVHETGGHPLFMHALASHAQASELGMSLDAVLQARMVALLAPARALLTVLCVAGRPITQEVAALAAALDGMAFAKATSVLRVAHLARTDGSRTSDTIFPYHDRVRKALVATLDEAQAVATHDALAAALEQTGGDARAIVRHALAAGKLARAAASAEVAAQAASETMAFDQAAEFYETALAFGTHDRATRLRLRLALAETLKSAGRGRAAAEAFMLAAEAAGPAQADPGPGIQCQVQAVEQWLISGNLDEGLAASATLLAGIGEPTARTPARALISLLWNRVRLRLGRKVYPERQEEQIDRESLNRLDVLRAMAMGLTPTDLVRSADFNVRFLLQARRAGEPVRLVQGLGVEACFLFQGERGGRRARALVQQMAAIAATRPEDRYLAGYVPGIDGIVSLNEGRFARAARLMENAEQVFVGPGGRSMLERNAVQMFRMIALRLGGMTLACRGAIATFLRDARRRGDTYFATTLRTYRTQELLACNQATQAGEYLAHAPWTPLEKGFHLQHYFALDARGELALYNRCAAAGLPEFARGFADIRRSLLLRNRLLRVVGRWLHARLFLSAVAGDATRVADWRAAGRIAGQLASERIGFATVYALLIRAGRAALAARSDRAGVIVLLRQSIAAAEEQGMAGCAAAARYRLGHVLGGEAGAALLAEAQDWCEREAIVAPDRYFEIIAPGFPA